MIPVSDFAASAEPPAPSGFVRRGFIAACLRRLRSMSRFARRTSPRLSAQEQAAGNIALLILQRAGLQAEHKVLVAKRAEAVRKHKSVTSLDKRLRLVTAQLLSIGGNQ